MLALTCALSACGAADDAGAGASDLAREAVNETTTAQNSLQISVSDGKGTTTTWSLTCDPAGGTHPDPAGACDALEKHADALAPVAPDAVCTMQYGGDDTATVQGTWQGEKVDAAFSLKNGCEISRWSALVPLLPATGAASKKSLTG